MQQERIKDYPMDEPFQIPELPGFTLVATKRKNGRRIRLTIKGPGGVEVILSKSATPDSAVDKANGAIRKRFEQAGELTGTHLIRGISVKPWPYKTILIFAPRRTDPKRKQVIDPLYWNCADCSRDIVVASASISRAAEEHAELRIVCVCVECGVQYQRPEKIVDLRPGSTLESTDQVLVVR